MEYGSFLEKLMGELQEQLGKGHELEGHVIHGLNGSERHTLIVMVGDTAAIPCVHLDTYYKDYISGKASISKAAQEMAAAYLEGSYKVSVDISCFMEWGLARHRIFGKLVSTERNVRFLQEVPHREFLDLSLVYYIEVHTDGAGAFGTVQVRNEHMGYWGVDEGMLYQEAWERINAEEAYFCSMADIFVPLLADMGLPEQGLWEGDSIYVLSNKRRLNGAVEICSPKVLEEAARHIGGDLWILPSSIHEVILLPCSQCEGDARQLATIVKSINETEVSLDEVLSDHVYRYSRESRRLEIAA